MKRVGLPGASESSAGCLAHGAAMTPGPAFSVIDALGGLVRLDRRSETLHGSLLLRAASCKPFMDGNKTGTHLWLSQAVLLSRDKERAPIQMTDELYTLITHGYEELLDELIARGLLIKDGYWHERLRAGVVVRQDGVVSIWTGLLVKPAPGVWLLSTGSFNRRALVDVRESVIAADENYTPLMVELDLASMLSDTMWLEAELLCLLPIRPGVEFSRANIRERPELGAAHNEFYGGRYLDTRAENKSVGRYRKLVANAQPLGNPGPARCELVHIAGPDVHTIETFTSCLGPSGPLGAEAAAALPFAMLRNFTPLEFDFDGLQAHLNNADADPHSDELLAVWRELYGEEGVRAVEWWTDYFVPNVPLHLGEPMVLVIPYVFLKTPPGWVTLADGMHYPGMDGLRGVVATDLFHHAGPVFQFRRPGEFRLKVADPLIRLLPVPRELLDAPYEKVDLGREPG